MLIANIFRAKKYGLGNIIYADTLYDEVDESLVHKPVFLIIAKKSAT